MRIGPVASGIAGVLALGTALWVYRLRNRAGRIDALCNLREFVVEEVLREDPITFLGRFPWQKPGERAVVKVNPTALEIADAPALLPHLAMQPSSYSGAEYCFFDAVPQLLGLLSQPPLRRGYKIEVIAPASERQIARCRPPGALVMIEETPEMYDAVVRASYESLRTAKVLGWLYNVLDRKKETERLLFHDEDPALGFILNVDTKWTSHPNLTATDRADWHHHKSVQWLYCLGICNRRDIPSLRDLTVLKALTFVAGIRATTCRCCGPCFPGGRRPSIRSTASRPTSCGSSFTTRRSSVISISTSRRCTWRAACRWSGPTSCRMSSGTWRPTPRTTGSAL